MMMATPRASILLSTLMASMVMGKELQLPPCEEIPLALCHEGRIRNFCQNRCGRLELEEREQKTHGGKPKVTLIPHPAPPKSVTPSKSNSESEKRNFLAPEPSNHGRRPPPRSSTLNPALAEEIEDFFNPKSTRATISPTTTVSRSTKKPSKSCDRITPCVPLSEANERFVARCKSSKMAGGCFGYCRYNAGLAELKNAFIRGICPIGQLRAYLKAASALGNNIGCCSATGVFSGRRAVCHPFCNPTGRVWPDRRESLKYLPCLGAFEQIMRCHWAGLVE